MRVMEGGHDVPIAKIVSRHARSLANGVRAVPIVQRMYLYDNSVDSQAPRLLFRISEGRLVKKYGEINEWAREILEASEPRTGPGGG